MPKPLKRDQLRDLPDGQISRFAVQPLSEKYFASRVGRNSSRGVVVLYPSEGRFAIVTNVGCGMRWTRAMSNDE
jgi:hypothetical protein